MDSIRSTVARIESQIVCHKVRSNRAPHHQVKGGHACDVVSENHYV